MTEVATEKVCCSCKETKPLTDFHRATKSRDGRQAKCAECARHHSSIDNWKKLGIDFDHDDYAELNMKQGGKCGICGELPSDRKLAVDHDHRTNTVRALLCMDCNTGLGKFGDSVELLEAAAAYLRKHHG